MPNTDTDTNTEDHLDAAECTRRAYERAIEDGCTRLEAEGRARDASERAWRRLRGIGGAT